MGAIEGRKPIRTYIAGPMKSLKLFNFPAFDEARNLINNYWNGFIAVSPADIDRDHGFDPIHLPDDYDWSVIPVQAGTREEIIRRDIDAVLSCDAIYMLPGWEHSAGAKAELHLARWAGKKIYHHKDAVKPHRMPEAVNADFVDPPQSAQISAPSKKEDILEEALRITGGDRMNSYGPPDQDFRRTGDMWTGLFRDMLKEGVAFEPFHVAQAMILLKMSRQLHQRKRDNWTDTAGYARCGALCDEAAHENG